MGTPPLLNLADKVAVFEVLALPVLFRLGQKRPRVRHVAHCGSFKNERLQSRPLAAVVGSTGHLLR